MRSILLIALFTTWLTGLSLGAEAGEEFSPRVYSYCKGQVVTLGQMDVRAVEKYAFKYNKRKQEALRKKVEGMCMKAAQITAEKGVPADTMIYAMRDTFREAREAYAKAALQIYYD